MLSLIATEQRDLALINSTDMTIRNPPHKDNRLACENAAVFIKPAHTPGINCRRPGQDRGAAGKRATALTGKVSIVTACWAEMMLIVEL